MPCVHDGDNLVDPSAVVAATKIGETQLWVVVKMQTPCAPFTMTFETKAKRNNFFDLIVAAMTP
jgi:hypothetical protein